MRLPFSNRHLAAGGVPDESFRKTVETDEAQATKDPLRANDLGKPLAVPESILQGEHLGAVVTQWRNHGF